MDNKFEEQKQSQDDSASRAEQSKPIQGNQGENQDGGDKIMTQEEKPFDQPNNAQAEEQVKVLEKPMIQENPLLNQASSLQDENSKIQVVEAMEVKPDAGSNSSFVIEDDKQEGDKDKMEEDKDKMEGDQDKMEDDYDPQNLLKQMPPNVSSLIDDVDQSVKNFDDQQQQPVQQSVLQFGEQPVKQNDFSKHYLEIKPLMDLIGDGNIYQEQLADSLYQAHGSLPFDPQEQMVKFSENDAMDNIFVFLQLVQFFHQKIKQQIPYGVSDSNDWPLKLPTPSTLKYLEDKNLKFSDFAAMLKIGQEISLSVLYPVRNTLQGQFNNQNQQNIADQDMDEATRKLIEQLQQDDNAAQIPSHNVRPQIPIRGPAMIQDDHKEEDPVAGVNAAPGQALNAEHQREAYGSHQTHRIQWFFDNTVTLNEMGILQREVDLINLKKRLQGDEQSLIKAILAKTTHPNILKGNRDNMDAIFHDRYILEMDQTGHVQTCWEKFDAAACLQLEMAYEGFTENIQRLGNNHVQEVNITSDGRQFYMILTKHNIDQNLFQIEDANNQARQLIRKTVAPEMKIQFTQQEFLAKQNGDEQQRLDISSVADQAVLSKFCSKAEERFNQRKGRVQQNRHLNYRGAENLYGDEYGDEYGEEFVVSHLQEDIVDEDQADFMAEPVKITSTGQNYLVSADQSNYQKPQIQCWPFSQNRPSYTLYKQISASSEMDLIASFLNMPVQRNQMYKLQDLSPMNFEYKLVETAFVQTGHMSMDPQKNVAGPAFGGRGYALNNNALLPHHKSNAQGRIIKIQKIFNPTIYDKFTGELKRQLKKYPSASVYDLTKLLFHGSNNTDPKDIYSSDYGLDNRFANAGLYGTGIYFANTSHYSRNFEHKAVNYVHEGKNIQAYQMFFVHVLVGESVSLPQQRLQVPPLKRDYYQQLKFSPQDQGGDVAERFDSVRNETSSHYIIYDYNKQYPGYLITYI